MKAFRASVEGFSQDGIYWAKNASKARYQAMLSAGEAGYHFTFSDFRVKRAPEYDPPEYNPRKEGIAECFVSTRKNRGETEQSDGSVIREG